MKLKGYLRPICLRTIALWYSEKKKKIGTI